METIMNISVALNRYKHIRYAYFHWRVHLSLYKKLLLSAGMACIIGLSAQIKIGLPWTPVPVTGQTFAVLLTGILLGGRWGVSGVCMYIAAGAVGIPWFSGLRGGAAVLAGPTGGYIIGFIPAAFLVGHISDTCVKYRKLPQMFFLMAYANFILIYIPGLIILGAYYYVILGRYFTISSLLLTGAVPFIAGDILKIAAAALIGAAITPDKPFIRENGHRT